MSALEPPPIAGTEGAKEILRVWGGSGLPQQVSLNITWKDPAAWGLLLVDIARHVSKAYAGQSEFSEEQALLRIHAGISAELVVPTDEPEQLR